MNFTNGAELLECCEKENKKISEVMFEREITFLEQDPEKTKKRMQKAWSIMQSAAKKPLKENIISMGGMIGGESRKLHELRENKKNLCGEVVSKAIAYAVGVLEVNASMGLIVAAPTAGSSGVIPGVFCSLKENYGFSDDEICQALFNAAAVGYLIQEMPRRQERKVDARRRWERPAPWQRPQRWNSSTEHRPSASTRHLLQP